MLGQLRFAVFVFVGVLVIVLLSCSLRSRTATASSTAAAPSTNRHVAEASKWASIAASETNPLLRLLHTNYALVAAKVGVETDTSSSLSAGEMAAFVARLETMQAASLKQLAHLHPKLKSDVRLAKAAGWV